MTSFAPRFAAAGLLAVVAIAASGTSGKRGAATALSMLTLVAVLIAFYGVVWFGGGGRIVVAGIAISAIFLVNWYRPTFLHKYILVAALGPGLIWGGVVRAGLAADQFGSVLAAGTGLGSVGSPLADFAKLAEMSGLAGLATAPSRWGATFGNSAVFWVPREIWANKPVGFGRELVQILEPNLLHTGHSLAATNHGEWLVNFGPIGLIIGAVVVGRLLGRLDAWSMRLRLRDGVHPIAVAVPAAISGNMVVYAWASSFSYTSRTVPLLVGLSLIWLGAVRALPLRGCPDMMESRSGNRQRGLTGVGGS